ncbi:MAG: pyruvate kinase [Clostridia bacterium]|nr:pyruvate kinase [Clostridia bacterium]
MREIKILCTIGPSCNDAGILAKMIDAGMDGARINLSHGSAASQEDKLKNFRRACEMRNAAGCSIMFDIRGPEIRVRDIPGGELVLEDGDIVTLHCEEEDTDSLCGYEEGCYFGNTLPINYAGLADDVEIGTEILIDDGKIRLTVEDVNENDIICHVDTGGKVLSRKGVNLPDIKLQMDYLGDDDKEDILFCIENGVDYIAGSFIRREEDVRILREFLNANGGSDIGIIAKIENKEAVSNIEGIAKAADQVLVARGDLGVEVGFERVPAIQKRIIRRCNELGTAVIVATQLIESMTESLTPTRAEVSDIANAVYDGATDLLVTGETAAGRYPVQVVEMLERIIAQAESDLARYGAEML